MKKLKLGMKIRVTTIDNFNKSLSLDYEIISEPVYVNNRWSFIGKGEFFTSKMHVRDEWIEIIN